MSDKPNNWPKNALNPEGFSFDPASEPEDYHLYEHLQPQTPDLSQYLVYDSLNRPDGPLGNSETGQPWQSIDTLGAGTTATLHNGQLETHGATAAIDPATSDVDMTVTYVSGRAPGLYPVVWLRASDLVAGNLTGIDIEWSQTIFAAYSYVADSTGSAFLEVAGDFTDPLTLRAVLVEQTLTILVNGVELGSAAVPDVHAGTLIGLGNWDSSSNTVWDNFSVTAP